MSRLFDDNFWCGDESDPQDPTYRSPPITVGITANHVPLHLPSPALNGQRVPQHIFYSNISPMLNGILEERGLPATPFAICPFFVRQKVEDHVRLIQVIWVGEVPLPKGIGRRIETSHGVFRMEHFPHSQIRDYTVLDNVVGQDVGMFQRAARRMERNIHFPLERSDRWH